MDICFRSSILLVSDRLNAQIQIKYSLMLKHTFTFLPGVGVRLEKHLWREGILVWEDFLKRTHIRGISEERKQVLDSELIHAFYALDNYKIDYFASRLPYNEHWRLFDVLRDDVICLDIETTGRPAGEGEVTIVGLYGKDKMQTLIKGINLDPKELRETLAQYKLIITYYGRVFDIPFLNKAIPGFYVRMPHYDLCSASHRLNIKGGLKKLETRLGIKRDYELIGMDGHDAVFLWKSYLEGDEKALNLLIKYNEADTKNLYQLADTLYYMLRKEYGPEKAGQFNFSPSFAVSQD